MPLSHLVFSAKTILSPTQNVNEDFWLKTSCWGLAESNQNRPSSSYCILGRQVEVESCCFQAKNWADTLPEHWWLGSPIDLEREKCLWIVVAQRGFWSWSGIEAVFSVLMTFIAGSWCLSGGIKWYHSLGLDWSPPVFSLLWVNWESSLCISPAAWSLLLTLHAEHTENGIGNICLGNIYSCFSSNKTGQFRVELLNTQAVEAPEFAGTSDFVVDINLLCQYQKAVWRLWHC